ncbi:MAG: hypothetical protein ACWA5P_13660 [bacterium]
MKKQTLLYTFCIVMAMILNFLILELVIRYGPKSALAPFGVKFVKEYINLIILIALPLVAVISTWKVVFRWVKKAPHTQRFKTIFVQILLSVNIIFGLWMLITGFIIT